MSDFLEIVEAAYAETADLTGWLAGLANTLEPHLNQGWGVCVARLSEPDGLASGSEGMAYATAGLPSDAVNPYLQGHGLQSPEQTVQVLRHARQAGPVVSMFAMVGAPTDKRDPSQRAVKHALEGGMRQVVLPRGARDVVMVLGDTMDGEYLGATALRRELGNHCEPIVTARFDKFGASSRLDLARRASIVLAERSDRAPVPRK